MNRELPILFNGDMVRAILDGRKTVTRRVAKKIPVETHRIEPIQPFDGGNLKFECHWGGYMPDVPGFTDGVTVVKNWWIDYHNKHRKSFLGSWWQDMPRTATEAYSYLWNSTVKKSNIVHYGWDANPWVWVIEFERCEKPEIL